MKYLFDCWEAIKKEIRGRQIFLFLDYDGTLVPIADTPAQAAISEQTKKLLERLSAHRRLKVAIISGRALSDIKKVVGVKGIFYAGNHGLELEGPKIKFRSQVSPGLKSVIREVYKKMLNGLSKIRGALIEDKGLTISAHYRLVDSKDRGRFLSKFCEITAPYAAQNKIKINQGKKVYEIRPPVDWNKGRVVLWLLARQQFLLGEDKVFPVYIGDDITDEDGFRALKNKGLTIFVGEPKASEADYYLKGPREAIGFIKQILELK